MAVCSSTKIVPAAREQALRNSEALFQRVTKRTCLHIALMIFIVLVVSKRLGGGLGLGEILFKYPIQRHKHFAPLPTLDSDGNYKSR
jgi:hypothetical protein